MYISICSTNVIFAEGNKVSFSDRFISKYIHNKVVSSQIQQLKKGTNAETRLCAPEDEAGRHRQSAVCSQ